jgi:hypothetical protein
MIRSKYKPAQLIFTLVVIALLIICAYAVFRNTPPTDNTKQNFGSFLLFSFAVYILIIFFQRSPRVSFDNDFITIKYIFKTNKYTWSSITQVLLSSNEYYSVLFILGQFLESTVINFDDGSKLILCADMYSNMSEMIGFISEKVSDKIKDHKSEVNNTQVQLIGKKVYAGSPYTSFNTLLILGMFVFAVVKLSNNAKPTPLLFLPIGFVLLLFVAFGTQMNYFIIDDGKLIIRNHYFFWKKKIYDLKEIRETVIESPYKRSNSLRIITNDFKSKSYGAGSLRNKNWQELFEDLSRIGITIRSDIYIG